MTLCEMTLGNRFRMKISLQIRHFRIGDVFHASPRIPLQEYIPLPMPRFGKSVTRTVLTRQTRARAGQTDESDIPTGEGCSRYPEEEP